MRAVLHTAARRRQLPVSHLEATADGIEVGASLAGAASSSSISAHSADTVLGIGGGFNLNRRLFLRLEYQKLKDVGDPDRTGEGDIDVIGLGLLFRL